MSRHSITQASAWREFIAQWQETKNKASDHAWPAVAHPSPRASQKARFLKSLQFSCFQSFVKQIVGKKQIVVIEFMKFYAYTLG